MTSNPPKEFRTDAIRPSAIQTGTLGRRTVSQLPSAGAANGEDSADALEKEYQRWNTRIDTEMVALSSGLRELIQFANISPNPPPHIHQTTPLQLKVTTSQIIRSTQNLRDIAHDLKLALLLSNQVDTTEKRDAEMRLVRDDIVRARRRVGEGIVGLLNGETAPDGTESAAPDQTQKQTVDHGGTPEDEQSKGREVADQVDDAPMEPVEAPERTEDAESPSTRQLPTAATQPADPTISPSTEVSASARVPIPPTASNAPVEDDSDDEDMEEV